MNKKEMSVQVKALEEEGVIEAYLNNFNFIDRARDNTQKGAFANSIKTINERGYNLPMLFAHDHSMICGHWESLVEDEIGLKATGRINLETELGREMYALVKSGSLSGVSIGYKTIREEWDRATKSNRLLELEVVEASLVSVPCSDISRIQLVKTYLEHGELPTQPELEKVLKEAGLSNSQSKMVVTKYRPEQKELKDYTQSELQVLISDAQDLLTTEELSLKKLSELFT